VAGFLYSQWLRAAAGWTAAAALAAGGSAPVLAQAASDDCSQFSGAEEVECLRQALSQTQEALNRAERALHASEPPRSSPSEAAGAALGAEQAARRAGRSAPRVAEERISTLIVASERVHPNQLQVHLENGQTWRQIQGDTQLVELTGRSPVSAEIWRSGFGGYRMRLPEIRRVLKVERIR
jgi:Xaa-Pro aminopeptidase